MCLDVGGLQMILAAECGAEAVAQHFGEAVVSRIAARLGFDTRRTINQLQWLLQSSRHTITLDPTCSSSAKRLKTHADSPSAPASGARQHISARAMDTAASLCAADFGFTTLPTDDSSVASVVGLFFAPPSSPCPRAPALLLEWERMLGAALQHGSDLFALNFVSSFAYSAQSVLGSSTTPIAVEVDDAKTGGAGAAATNPGAQCAQSPQTPASGQPEPPRLAAVDSPQQLALLAELCDDVSWGDLVQSQRQPDEPQWESAQCMVLRARCVDLSCTSPLTLPRTHCTAKSCLCCLR